jgi:hypothetical protein
MFTWGEMWCMTHDVLGSSPRGMIVGFGHDIKNTMNIEEHYKNCFAFLPYLLNYGTFYLFGYCIKKNLD